MVRANKRTAMVSLKSVSCAYILFVMLLYALSGPLIGRIVPFDMLQIALVVSVLFVELALIFRRPVAKSDIMYVIVILVMAVFPILSIRRSSWSIITIVYYIDALLFMVVMLNWTESFGLFEVMMAVYAFYAVCTIVFYFTPGFYRGRIVNLFPSMKDRLLRMYNQGYMPGFTDHYSTNGMFLAVGILLSFCRMRLKNTTANKLVFALMIIAMMMSGKRAHFLFSFFAVFIYYYCLQRRKGGNAISRWFRVAGIVLTVAVVLLIVMQYIPALSAVLQRLRLSDTGGDISNGRFMLWRIAINSIRSHPLRGIGWKTYANSLSWMYSTARTFDTHNVYLQLLCETGIIGFAVYMIWFVALYRLTFRVLVDAKLKLTRAAEQALGFSMCFQTFFLLYCFTGNPLYEKIMFFPYFLSCGIALWANAARRRQLRRDRIQHSEVE